MRTGPGLGSGGRRLAVVAGLVLAWTAMALVRPSWACGCGAMIAPAGSTIRVTDETSIVRYDDATRTEQIVLRLAVRTTARDAAWLFPTPSAADVKLGDRAWLPELDRLTTPRTITRRHWWTGRDDGDGATAGAAPGAGARSVNVLSEQRLGPFQVATLAAGDSGALAGWLGSHGYRLSPRLSEGLRPYVDMGWRYVAVKLAPGATGQTLNGGLDPLHITFRTDRIVYPMRLSRLATTPQNVHLYVLAAHRVAREEGPFGHVHGTAFAGWVRPEQVRTPGLRTFLGGRVFLTELQDDYMDPERITGDFHFRYTGDTQYRETEYRDEYVTVLGLPAGWVIVFLSFAAGAGIAAAAVLTGVRRRDAA